MKIGIVGLGYVGLPLAVEFCEVGHEVVGVDADQRRVAAVERGESYIEDISDAKVARLTAAAPSPGRIYSTTSFDPLGGVDAVSICVPTPPTILGMFFVVCV